MGLQAEHTVHDRIVSFFLQKRHRKEIPLRLAHLARLVVQVVHMEPVTAPLVSQIALGLCDLVGVMRKNIVHAAAVDIHIFTQMLDADAGTLDMPSRVSHAPRTIPFERLILEFGLCKPQNEIIFVPLIDVLLHIVAHTD